MATVAVRPVTVSRPWTRWRPYLFTLAPLVGTIVIAALGGALSDAGCGPAMTMTVLFGGTANSPACESIPLTADLPSLLLGCTASIAAWLYWQSEARWSRLPDDLSANGLFNGDCHDLFTPKGTLELRLSWWVSSRPGRLTIALVVAVGSVAFYATTYSGAYLFRDYASSQHLVASWQSVRADWWANWHVHPVLALSWMAVGGAGVYAAVLDMTSFVLRTLIVFRIRDSDRWQFVPSRGRVRHPWEPLMRFANVRVWGLVTFLVTLADLVYLARAPHAGGARNYLLVLLAVTVFVATLAPMRMFYGAVTEAHEGSVTREVRSVAALDTVDPASSFELRTYVLLRRAELFLLGVPPSISALAKMTRAAAGLVALAGFVASIYQVSIG